MQAARQTAKLDALGRRLAEVSFDDDVWDDSLEELRDLFRAEGALAYRVSAAPSGFRFEFLHKALAPDPEAQRAFDAFTKFVLASSKSWPAYDPERPAPWQRNRAVAERELSRRTGEPNRLARLYEAMGAPWKDPDQVRVLICDGARMLGWVGVVGKRRFDQRTVGRLQRLVPALRARLSFDELVRERDVSRAALDAAFDAIHAPSLLLDRHGRILHMNDPARLLEERHEEVFDAARRSHERADSRCEVRRVAVRGLSPMLLVTIRSSGAESERDPVALRWGRTPRQKSVLDLVASGLSNKQIGARLGISEGTVELHMTAILRKARVESRVAVVAKYWSDARDLR